MNSNIDVLVIGAGFAGIYMLHKAREAGFSCIAIDSASGVGGTWFYNRYPGARVDIQSLEYSYSFSEELQQEWKWSERYASQPEILRYANHVVDRFNLRNLISLKRDVVSIKYNENENNWSAAISDGEHITAKFVAMAGGALSVPNKPKIDGLSNFRGEIYHTASWPLDEISFAGKKVAVIGTGSSGVQIIPEIAKTAAQLSVIQRTAPYCIPARNAPMDSDSEAKIKADYSGFRQRNLRTLGANGSENPANNIPGSSVTNERRRQIFEERWQKGGLSFMGAFSDLLTNLDSNFFASEFVKEKISSIVTNESVAKRLQPSHVIGCKRICLDSGYYEVFNQDNVRLFDVNETPIERVHEGGIFLGGESIQLDMIVYATGFDAMTGALTRMDMTGTNGRSIQQEWSNGPVNYLGLTIAHFPNFFNIAGVGSASPFTNVIISIEHHVNWIVDCISYMRSKNFNSIEAEEMAQSEWVSHVDGVASKTLMKSCGSWYSGANIEGKARVFMPYLGFPAYTKRCAQVADNGYKGFTFS